MTLKPFFDSTQTLNPNPRGAQDGVQIVQISALIVSCHTYFFLSLFFVAPLSFFVTTLALIFFFFPLPHIYSRVQVLSNFLGSDTNLWEYFVSCWLLFFCTHCSPCGWVWKGVRGFSRDGQLGRLFAKGKRFHRKRVAVAYMGDHTIWWSVIE